MSSKSALLTVVWVLLALVAAVVFVGLVVVRVISKLGLRGPCPYAVAWIVDNPIRRRAVPAILDRIGIRPGERVLELGPGPGAFTLPAAQRAGPGGRVIAVDIQPQMIAAVQNKVAAAGVTNVETHVASAYELPLPGGSVDRAFLVTVLAEIPDRHRALVELHRVLKPGGILSLTEQFMDPDYPLAGTEIRWAEEAGFRLVERYGSFWMYTLNFHRLPSRSENHG
jgi:ubiquinone/menaquinone biosynthesis C-methylase UbiE